MHRCDHQIINHRTPQLSLHPSVEPTASRAAASAWCIFATLILPALVLKSSLSVLTTRLRPLYSTRYTSRTFPCPIIVFSPCSISWNMRTVGMRYEMSLDSRLGRGSPVHVARVNQNSAIALTVTQFYVVRIHVKVTTLGTHASASIICCNHFCGDFERKGFVRSSRGITAAAYHLN